MRSLVLVSACALLLAACGPESSPEGRMGIKIDKLQNSLDSLKAQNAMMKDSLGKLSAEVSQLKK
jgi:hypothetical protein